jgi:predicted transcriptional regulator
MQINLEPEVIEIMERMQAAGMKGSIEQIANRALRLNLDLPELRRRQEELKRLILEGIESADRGELYDGDEVFDEILRELDEKVRSS